MEAQKAVNVEPTEKVKLTMDDEIPKQHRAAKKLKWTQEEDDIIRRGKQEKKKWKEIACLIPNGNRSGKACRERWENYLQHPRGETRRPWDELEEKLIVLGVEVYNQKFERILSFFRDLQDRTSADLKNRWHGSLSKRITRTDTELHLALKGRPRGRPKAHHEEADTIPYSPPVAPPENTHFESPRPMAPRKDATGVFVPLRQT